MRNVSVLLVLASLTASVPAAERTPILAIGELEVATADRRVSRIAQGVIEELYTAIGGARGMQVAVRHGLRPLIDEAALSAHGASVRAADLMLRGKLARQADRTLRLDLELAERSGARGASRARYTVRPAPPFTDVDKVLQWVRQAVGAGERGVRGLATRPESETSVAVLPFGYVDGSGGRTAFGDVIAGLAAIEIDNVPGVHSVERENLDLLWQELARGLAGGAREQSAPALEGADWFLCGSYLVHEGSLRVLMRLVDPGTGLVGAASVREGNWQDIGKTVRSATRVLFQPGDAAATERPAPDRTAVEEEAEARLKHALERAIASGAFPDRIELQELEAGVFLRPASAELLWYLGKRNFATGDLGGQIWAYRNFSDRFPDDGRAPQALQLLARAYGARRDWRGQKRVLGELMTRYPKSPAGQNAPEALADLAHAHGRSDTAAAMYRKGVAGAPSPEAERRRLVKLARCHAELLDFDEAAAVFRQLLAKHPGSPETQAILPELVRVAIAAGDIECARMAFGKLAKAEPHRRGVHTVLTLNEILDHGRGGDDEAGWVATLAEGKTYSWYWRKHIPIRKRCTWLLKCLGRLAKREVAGIFWELDRAVFADRDADWDAEYESVCRRLASRKADRSQSEWRWQLIVEALTRCARTDEAERLMREQEEALCRYGSERAAALWYAARVNAARGRHREGLAALLAAWEHPRFEPDKADLGLAIRSFECLDDLAGAARFVAGVKRLADSSVAAEAHLRLGQAYEAKGLDEQAIDAYWRAFEQSHARQHECPRVALDSIRRVATRNLWHRDVARVGEHEVPQTDAGAAKAPSGEARRLSLVAYPVNDAILVGGYKLDIYRTALKAIVRRDGLPVCDHPVYFRFRPLTSTGVGFAPRIRGRLVYTDVNGAATAMLRSGDLEETLEVLVSAGRIEQVLRVKLEGITGLSMVGVTKHTPKGLRAASIDTRVTRCMCRMPGDDQDIDLVRIEAIATAKGQRLPEFPMALHVSPAAGTDAVRKLSGKTDHEGRVTRVVRVPAGAEVVVRAMPGSTGKVTCKVCLSAAKQVAESRGFAQCLALPVRGKSEMVQQ